MFLEFSNGEKTIRIFSGVKGLVSHGDELRELLEKLQPMEILITIPEEQVRGLQEFLKDPFEMTLSDYEIIYGLRLHKYGEVMTPPPIYIVAVQFATSHGIPVRGIDLEDKKFNDAYMKHVKTFALVRHSIRKKKIINYDFHDTNPYEFAEAWIKRINSIKGFERLDIERLAVMNNEIDEFIKTKFIENHIIIVDHEFYAGIRENLIKIGFRQINSGDDSP
jgi:hypothetical protein